MEPKDLLEHFDHLETRLLEVLAEREDARRQLAASDQDRERLRQQVKQQAEAIKKMQKKQETLQNNFQKQHNISKIVSSMNADEKGTAELKGKIEAYIQDIDRCITFLGQSQPSNGG